MFSKVIKKITQNKYYLIGAISILLLLVTTLGMAALRTTLSFVGNNTIRENSWIIYFDSVNAVDDSVTPTNGARIVDNGKTRIEFTVDLKPGEIYEFTVDTVNDGTIDAMVDHIEKYELSEEQQKYLEFDVIYTDEGVEPYYCTPLLANGGRRELKVTVKYKDVYDYHYFPTEDIHLDLYFDIFYVQDIGCRPAMPKTLTVDPNGGVYNGRTTPTVYYLKSNSDVYDDSVTLTDPTRTFFNFDGWEVTSPQEDGTYLFNPETGLFNIGSENVVIRANWLEGNYVARIENTYYPTIQAAFNDAGLSKWTDNTVHLLKDTFEHPVNNTNKAFKFDLEAHTVTGSITNSSNGNITLINGKVKAGINDEEAFVNNGTLTLGQNDGVVQVENSISLVGNSIGLKNNVDNGAIFNFYDGYVEGDSAIVRGYKNCPEHYVVFVNHNNETNKQKAYLVNDSTRAVAKIDERSNNEGLFYYYVLQDAFNAVVETKATTPSLGDNRYVIQAIRDFEAPYSLSVPEDSRVFFDINGYKIYTGETLTNEGYLKIYNSRPSTGFIRPSKTFTNTSTGTLLINDLELQITTDNEVINNAGVLNVQGSTIHGQHTYAINNNGSGTILFDEDTFIDSLESYGLYNTSDDLVINNGTIYGFKNASDGASITGGDFEIYHWTTETYSNVYHHYVPAIANSGTLNISDADVENTIYDTASVTNSGTLNISGGTFESDYRIFENRMDNSSGIINITGGSIHSVTNVVHYGDLILSNNAEISSDEGYTVYDSDVTLTSGKIYTTSGTALYQCNATITSGEIYTEDGIAVDNRNYNNRTLTVNGGSVYSLNGSAVYKSDVVITNGTIEGTTYGLEDCEDLTISGGTITSDNKAVDTESATITGGIITSSNDALTVDNLSMTNGTITSTDANGIVLNDEGIILSGTVTGDIYGILSNGDLTIGTDDGTISRTSPVIIGESVGVKINGENTAFFDGILKGTIDGYEGNITQTPLGGTTSSGTETIDGVLYQTDFIIDFDDWLEIDGVGTFNSIDDASSAIADGGTATIKVIDDVVPSFIQHFVDENHNKTITFDMNGHVLKSTQTAYNNDSNVTIIDSVGTGKIESDSVSYFENDYNMTINGGKYYSTCNKAPIRNFRHGTLTIEDAFIRTSGYGIQTMGHTIINDVDLVSEGNAIEIEVIDTLYDHAFGSLEMNDGDVTASLVGVYGLAGSFVMNGGNITSVGNGAEGMTVSVTGGSIHSTGDKGIYTDISITVSGGSIVADTNYGLYGQSTITVTNGYVEGTKGITHYPWYNWLNQPCYEAINISGGTIKGITDYGVHVIGNVLTVTGGEIYGEVDGIYNQSTTTLGSNEGTISTTSPLIQGKRYGINTEKVFNFFDGILKGKSAARNGQVNLIPDSSMVKNDYEFIDRVEYKTQYLEPVGDWLQVGDSTYNSLYAAQEAIEDYGTIYVINDVSINFEQSLVAGKHVTLDLNGHQVMMTKSLTTKGINTITDSSQAGTGELSNNSQTEDLPAILNQGTLTINKGTYSSNRDYAIENSGTMVIDDIYLVANGAINNNSTLTINGGYIESTHDSRYALRAGGTVNITGGTIVSDTVIPIKVEASSFNMSGGTVTGGYSNGIYVSTYYGSTTISGGDITGLTNGIYVSDNHNNFTISGGHIIGQNECGVISQNENTFITGGILEGATYGLSVSRGATIGVDDRNVRIDSPIIKGDTYGLNAEGTLNFNDGILKGMTGSEQGQITNIPSGTQIYSDSEVINSHNYYTKYLIQEQDIAYNVQLDRYYNNLQLAFTEAQDNNTIELLSDAPIYYTVTNDNTHPFTLDLKGFTLSTNKSIINNQTLSIVDSLSNGMIKGSASINIIVNNGTMTIGDINLSNNSSNSYIVRNNSTLTMNNTTITGINAIQNTSNVTINNATITASSNAIDSSGILTINGGTYTAYTYALYNNGSQANSVSNATLNGIVYNYRNQLTLDTCNLTFEKHGNDNQYLYNAGTIILDTVNITGNGYTNNSGTETITDSTISLNSVSSYSGYLASIYNSGTLTIDNSKVYMDINNTNSYSSYGISNTGTATITNGSEIKVGNNSNNNSSKTYYGLYANNGTVTVNDSDIEVNGGNTAYGIYVDNSNATVNFETGNIVVDNTKYAFGARIVTGTLNIGHFDDVSEESNLVSITNPYIYADGDIRGIGIKNVNGTFGFYDGIIWASTYSKPEATNRVENLYEASTYVDEITSFENCKLEFMGSNWDNTTVAKIGNTSYYNLQSAINAYVYNVSQGNTEPDEVILLMRSVDADTITIPSNKHIVIDLNGMSLTASVENEGILQLYNGTLIQLSDEDNPEYNDYLNNYGTLILGKDDGTVSSSSMRVISENTAINNIEDDEYSHRVGSLYFYDGYIEGNPAINGSITEIAEYARLYTKTESQYERIYIQSLSREAIEAGETDLIVTIDPDGGTFKGHDEVFQVYLNYVTNNTYELLPEPTKFGCNFMGWEISEPDVYDDTTHTITIGFKDVNIKAIWEIDSNVVAKIGNNYYYSIQQAQDAAHAGDTIELIKDVTLASDVTLTITKDITLDLGGYTLSGAVVNNAVLTLINGTLTNPNGIGLVNNKTVTLGIYDLEVDDNYIKIIGTSIGVQQNGRFNMYDGTIEGDIALIGAINSMPKGKFPLTKSENNRQYLKLSGTPELAVAAIQDHESGTSQYYFYLTDAIAASRINGEKIDIVQNFPQQSAVTIESTDNIRINLNSFTISVSNTFTNNGTLLIYDESENPGSILFRNEFVNNANLTIKDISFGELNNNIIITNNGSLSLENASIIGGNNYAVDNYSEINLDADSIITSNSYAILNNSDDLTINSGEVSGIDNRNTLTIQDGAYINVTSDTAACITNGNTTAVTTVTGGVCESEGYGIYLDTNSSGIDVSDFTITSKKNGLYSNVRTKTITFDNVDLTSDAEGIYIYEDYTNLTVEDSYIKSNNSKGYYINGRPYYEWSNYTHTFTDSTIEGKTHSVYICGTNFYADNVDFISHGYEPAVYFSYSIAGSITNGSTITAEYGSGITFNGEMNYTISDTTINAGRYNAKGVYINAGGTYTLTNNTINAPEGDAFGIYISSGSSTTNINNTTVNSGHIGLQASRYNTVYINSGSIIGSTYGVYMYNDYNDSNGPTVNVGTTDSTLSTTIPYVSGGLYGIYRAHGSINFYNGRLRGYIDAYYDVLSKLRNGQEIAEELENVTYTSNVTTKSTSNYSSTPTAQYAKQNNGYAKITYIGETQSGLCDKNQEFTFNYKGSEDTFTVPCTGAYRLEVWGAQGGNDSSSFERQGGLGGYSVGEINLTIHDILYINVGGQGTNTYHGTALGGYNGGGTGYVVSDNSSYYYSISGGGATHIATRTGLLKDLSNNRSDILIVAGGGGAAYYSGYYMRAQGGHAGGYQGNYSKYYYDSTNNFGALAKGGTQTSGGAAGAMGNDLYLDKIIPRNNGSFGQGGDTVDTLNQVCINGGGGGYFGGGAGYQSPGAGGSSYLSNLLTNAVMYGYGAKETPGTYYNDYLVEKAHFLRTDDGETFNNYSDALGYIHEHYNDNAKLTVILTQDVQEVFTIPTGYTIELDLAGLIINSNQSIVNNGTLTISDSSLNKAGKFVNNSGVAILNNGSFTLGQDAKIEASSHGIRTTGVNSVTMLSNSKITAGDKGIYVDTKSSYSPVNITMTNATINASGDGIYFGDYPVVLNITNSTITSGGVGIYCYNGNNSYRHTLNLTGSTIESGSYALRLYRSNTTVDSTTLKTTGTEHAIYFQSDSVLTLQNNTHVLAPNASGIYHDGNNSTINLTNSEIKSDKSNGYGIQISGSSNQTVNLNTGAIITTTGNNSIGVGRSDSNSYFTLNVNGGTINSSNIGLYANSYSTCNINTGSIIGTNYGIYMGAYDTNRLPVVNVGNGNDTYSSTNPKIVGNIAINKTYGSVNFYNGIIEGSTKAYDSEFLALRSGHKVVEVQNYIDPDNSNQYDALYLDPLENFLEAPDGHQFNVLNDAIKYMEDNYNGVGKITVTRNQTVQESSTIPSGDQIELDLAGNTLTITQTITNNGQFTISDSSNGTGLLNNISGVAIDNKSAFILDENAHLQSYSNAINATANNGTIQLKNGSNVKSGAIGIYLTYNQTITMNGATLESDGDSISIYTYPITINMTNSTIKSGNNGIYSNSGNIYNRHSINITGSTIEADNYALYGFRSNTVIDSSTLITNNTKGNDYTIYSNERSSITLQNNSYILAPNGSGIYINSYDSTINISDSEIKVDKYNAYGIYVYNNYLTINLNSGAKIITPGGGAVGVGKYDGSNGAVINVNGGSITSGNIAILSTKESTYNIISGNIVGANYGVYMDDYNGGSTVNIGRAEDQYNNLDPFIEGGLYGIYKESGSMNFYNGRLKGSIGPYEGDFSNLRSEHKIYMTSDTLDTNAQSQRTYSTTEYTINPVANKAKLNDGYARITYNSESAPSSSEYLDKLITTNSINPVIEYDYSDNNLFTYNIPENAYYKLEVWGAQGGGRQTSGNSEAGFGGKGGYSSGIISLTTSDTLYVVVGGQGKTSNSGLAAGGYNGGGSSWATSSGDPAAGGGGATDIRINNNDLYNRVIVAGGGGGGGEDAEQGGAGGGLTGVGSYPGTQTGTSSGGVFGLGGNTTYDGGAGGGGWYGAGVAGGSQNIPTSNSGNDANGGSGGSGYVFTSTSSVVEGYQLTSTYYLTNTTILSGEESFTDYRDGKSRVGNEGDGHARITYLGSSSSYTINYQTSIGTLSTNSRVFASGSKLGEFPNITLSDEYIVEGWYFDQAFTKSVDKNTTVYMDAILYANVIQKSNYCSSSAKRVYDFDYIGDEQELVIPCAGTYKLEVWGAQGGSLGTYYSGGPGGYSTAKIDLLANEKLYINIGGTTDSSTGGYNGGANGTNNHLGGGGATHIATSTGQLYQLINNKEDVIIVAGGGGGANTSYGGSYGGAGGGYKAQNGYNAYNSSNHNDNVGTGGSVAGPGYYYNNSNYGIASFGKGAISRYENGPGGGGGYYGGGGGYYYSGAGGGSGYNGSTRTYDKNMYGYNVDTKFTTDIMNIAYLVPNSEFLYNKTQDKKYTSFDEAFTEANNNDEFELREDISNTSVLVIPNKTLTLDLNGHDFLTAKGITNNGTLTITNLDTQHPVSLHSNISITLLTNTNSLTISNIGISSENAIVNSGALNLSGVTVTSTGTAINNSGSLTIGTSNITGGTYALYDSSTVNNTINNSSLTATTSIQKSGSGRLIITDTPITGNINNTNNSSILGITNRAITGGISNAGVMTLNTLNVSNSYYESSEVSLITNSGSLTLNTVNLTVDNSSGSSHDYFTQNVLNTGTLTSTSSHYESYRSYSTASTYRYKKVTNVNNQGIFTSTNDTFESHAAKFLYGVYNDTTSTTTINNPTFEQYYGDNTAGIYVNQGTVNVTNGSFETYGSTNGRGIYVAGGTITTNGSSFNIYDNTLSEAAYVNAGTYNLQTGTISTSGATSYGIRLNTGTFNLGVEDGNVSTTDPSITAVGTTSGIGVSMGNGTFNMFDGIIYGNTSALDTNNIPNNVENHYRSIEYPADVNHQYPYCILVFVS